MTLRIARLMAFFPGISVVRPPGLPGDICQRCAPGRHRQRPADNPKKESALPFRMERRADFRTMPTQLFFVSFEGAPAADSLFCAFSRFSSADCLASMALTLS